MNPSPTQPHTSTPPDRCNTCKFRASVPGSAHSTCNSTALGVGEKREHVKFLILSRNLLGGQPLGPLFDVHARRNGWANWPVDFDPGWMIGECRLHSNQEAIRQAQAQATPASAAPEAT